MTQIRDETILDGLQDYKPEVLHLGEDYAFTVEEGMELRVFDSSPSRYGGYQGTVVFTHNGFSHKTTVAFANAKGRQMFFEALAGESHPINDSQRQAINTLFMELDHMLRRAELAVGKGEPRQIYTAGESLDLDNMPLPELAEIVESLAIAGGYTLLVGEGGVGKSARAMTLGLSAASGKPFLGFRVPEPVKVLYLNLEMSEYEFRTRLNKLVESFPGIAINNFEWVTTSSFDISLPTDQKWLDDAIAERGTRLLIVDNHSWWHGDKDENSNAEMMAYVVIPSLAIANRHDCGMLLMHHTPWGQDRPRGAVALYNAASIALLLEPTKQEWVSKLTWKKWRAVKGRRPVPIETRYDRQTYLVHRVSDDFDIVKSLGLPCLRSEAVKAISQGRGISPQGARTRVKKMVDIGLLDEDGKMLKFMEKEWSETET